MRRVRYRVAASLDGYIAGPNGEIDWIVHDPTIDFASVYSGFDTVLLGRRTYEMTRQPGAPPWPPGWRIHVFSRTLDAAEHPGVTVGSTDIGAAVADLRAESGGDIWLFGGASLFASLLAADQVDQVEVAIMPVILGAGVPLAASNAPQSRLSLTRSDARPSGIVTLEYDVVRAAPPRRSKRP
jgi:dihydrofolate reductase